MIIRRFGAILPRIFTVKMIPDPLDPENTAITMESCTDTRFFETPEKELGNQSGSFFEAYLSNLELSGSNCESLWINSLSETLCLDATICSRKKSFGEDLGLWVGGSEVS